MPSENKPTNFKEETSSINFFKIRWAGGWSSIIMQFIILIRF